MDGGWTAHPALKLSLNANEHEFPVCDVPKSSVCEKILKQCKVIIWNESTIAQRKPLEKHWVEHSRTCEITQIW